MLCKTLKTRRSPKPSRLNGIDTEGHDQMAFKSTWTPPQRARDKPIPQEPPRLSGGFTYSAGGGVAVAKSPANRLFDLRRLAKGEECTVRRFDGWCACQPETTVWGHTNSLSDRKGLGYKGNDAAGFFV